MLWVIWSEEHRAWWGAARWGYVVRLTDAGRYTEAEAREIVKQANRAIAPPRFNEIAVPDPLPAFQASRSFN
jgi:hypothetical protein